MYGSFLRAVRQSRGLSQGQLASVVGISQPNLSAYEQDRRAPSIDTLNRLLVACGYQLVAKAGPVELRCPLPRVGWFPDEDDPPSVEGDPLDEAPALAAGATDLERAAVVTAVLELASERT